MPLDKDTERPLILNDGNIVTDSGQMIFVQYVDIGVKKLRKRPRHLMKATEAMYGLEYSPTIRISAPLRFHDFGETFIQDDQEGRAHHTVIEKNTTPRDLQRDLERERALSALGQESVKITRSDTTNTHTNYEDATFGKSSWIYSTSIAPTPDQREEWRRHLPESYDHVSTIRQPVKFAQALGLMLADQIGPQGQKGTMSHDSSTESVHDTQLVIHGPVWYTADVLGFIRTHESEPLYLMYPLFVKDLEYQAQREYRFVVHCENPVKETHLDLLISGMMRDSLAPFRSVSAVEYNTETDSEEKPPSMKMTSTTPKKRTTTRTRRVNEKQRLTIKSGDSFEQNELIDRERIITLTTETTADRILDAGGTSDPAAPAVAEVTETEIRRMEIGGVPVHSSETVTNRIVYIEGDEDADSIFSLEERDVAMEILEAVKRPFTDFSNLPSAVSAALMKLAVLAHGLSSESEFPAISACWNGLWAICNICTLYGDVIESVAIEQREFVAVGLKCSQESKAQGKLLIGPLGTYAYVIRRGTDERFGSGGEETRLYIFPDHATQEIFKEFGWTPDGDGNNEDESTEL